MTALAAEVFGSLESYWRRRRSSGYKKLGGSPRKKRVVKLGGGARRSWKLRRVVRPFYRLRSAMSLPGKLLARLRDAYIDTMVALAGGRTLPSAVVKKGAIAGDQGSWSRRMPQARQMSSRRRGDFEERMMVHIYNSIMDHRELLSCQ